MSSYESASYDCDHGVPARHHRAGLSVGYKARLTRTVTGAPISGEAITFTAGTSLYAPSTAHGTLN